MPLSAGTTGAIIMAFAVVQIVVHMVFFLHMTPKAEGGWSLTSVQPREVTFKQGNRSEVLALQRPGGTSAPAGLPAPEPLPTAAAN